VKGGAKETGRKEARLGPTDMGRAKQKN